MLPRPKIHILDAEQVSSEALAAFFREVWDPRALAESVSRSRREAAIANLAEPGIAPPTTVVLVDDRIVGHCGSLPVELWDGDRLCPAYWVKGLMVLPEFRNGPIGHLVLKELVGRLRRSVVLTVARASVRLFEALGYVNLGTVPNYVCILRPGRVASTAPVAWFEARLPGVLGPAIRFAQRRGVLGVGGAAAGLGIRAVTAIHGLSRVGFSVDHSNQLPPAAELDRLWLAGRGRWCGVARNARYLGQRYRDERYHFVMVGEQGTLRALAILRAPRKQDDERVKGLSLGVLSDLLVRRGDWRAAIAATRGALILARRLGGDALLASTPSPWLGRLLMSQAWLPVPGNLRFLVRDHDRARPWPTPLGQWWLMRGDGESDGAL